MTALPIPIVFSESRSGTMVTLVFSWCSCSLVAPYDVGAIFPASLLQYRLRPTVASQRASSSGRLSACDRWLLAPRRGIQAFHRSIDYFRNTVAKFVWSDYFPRSHGVRHRQRVLKERHRRIFFLGPRLIAKKPLDSIHQRGNKCNPAQQLRQEIHNFLLEMFPGKYEIGPDSSNPSGLVAVILS
jgi:hypothetical protein